ncbi:histidinol-phosphatase [Paraliobacillus quinghaiensis]|uniref:Histidinol-phosphatase n=1 Tax=Paraliobacillus quinghaiensis TaxID=470815 RepID=A0A917TVQ9_9BACI|nr:histidinol-phosphatase HisJ [Paraliobacillus quinghaiensis]GGM37755.1 histidinol-phosphatase [Paraliobacillus quinghaiensis]
MQPTGDFHVHTNFCPHGSLDKMESYVKEAIENNLQYLSFTEHAPLPRNFIDPTPASDSAMKWEDVEDYIKEGNRLKEKYRDQISILIGFEVDFIEGYHQDTEEFLNQYGDQIDDAILSVHMLKAPDNTYVCIDYSTEEFERIISLFGSIEFVYETYYQTVKSAIKHDLGKHKPTRIGHLTLIEKFANLYPTNKTFDSEIDEILKLIKEKGYMLDLNTAGLYKTHCKSIYPNQSVIKKANQLSIPFVTGSDSHEAKTIARGFDQLPTDIMLSVPSKIYKS